MSDVETRFLPLLPLSTGVVLPQMVVPLGLESDEAKPSEPQARNPPPGHYFQRSKQYW